ncbi:MAG: hypothetical protein AB8G95_01220 [Anaerolineae bacterium]
MNWRKDLSYALTGWLGGLAAVLILGLSWPIIFPAIINVENYYGSGPGLPAILGIVASVITLPALIGGLIGGRVSVEGGERGQRTFAVIFGILLSSPLICFGLWFFTGF